MSFSIPGITTQNTARDKMIKTCDAYVAWKPKPIVCREKCYSLGHYA